MSNRQEKPRMWWLRWATIHSPILLLFLILIHDWIYILLEVLTLISPDDCEYNLYALLAEFLIASLVLYLFYSLLNSYREKAKTTIKGVFFSIVSGVIVFAILTSPPFEIHCPTSSTQSSSYGNTHLTST